MGSSAAQLLFTAEFVIFLVTLAGLALVLLRPELVSRRLGASVVMGSGFTLISLSGFLHGSLLVSGSRPAPILTLRGVGVLAVAVASVAWAAQAPARVWLWTGLGLVAASVGLSAGGATNSVVQAPLIGGAVAIGVSLILVSQRAIAARVAASTTVALLLLTLVLSVALSQVAVSNVRNDALRRLDNRAASEVTVVTGASAPAALDARILGASIQGYLINNPGCGTDGGPGSYACISRALGLYSATYFSGVYTEWVEPQARGVVATSSGSNHTLGPAAAAALASGPAVSAAISTRTGLGTLAVVDGHLLAVGAYPDVVVTSGAHLAGVAVVASVLDSRFLIDQVREDPSVSLALADSSNLLSTSSPSLDFAVARGLVASVMRGSGAASTTTANLYVTVQPILDSARRPVAALVASTSTNLVDSTRNSIYRTLFLIAFGGTLLALLAVAVVADRVGNGIRRLTSAALAIRRGETGVRTGVRSEDEVGVLGEAFDAMASSVEETTDALRRAAEAEGQLRSRLEVVIAGMGEALVAVGPDGGIIAINRAAEELFGIDASVALGQPMEEVVAFCDEHGLDRSREMRRAGLGRWEAEGWVYDIEASLVPVAISAGPLRDMAWEEAGGVYVVRDRRREMEVERMKTEFLSRIGHELRTPLTGIMGYTELLAHREASPERVRTWNLEVLDQSKRLLRTVEMLEFFASSGGGMAGVGAEEVDLGQVIDGLSQRWEERLAGRNTVTRKLARNLGPVRANQRWVTKALDELVVNAAKFSSPGTPIVMSAKVLRDIHLVEVSVTDRGKGMSSEELSRVFTDFTQGDNSDTRQYGGLGLGLSLVKQVAEASGGGVACRSRAGRGTTVSVTFPLA
ncbi:MAG: sensor histidine kinase [Acidimicrobiales bacterium]